MSTKESLAERIKRTAIQSSRDFPNNISTRPIKSSNKTKLELELEIANSKAKEIINDLDLFKVIDHYIEINANAYRDIIQSWKISIELGKIYLYVIIKQHYKPYLRVAPKPAGKVLCCDKICGKRTLSCLSNLICEHYKNLGLTVYKSYATVYISNLFTVGIDKQSFVQVNSIKEIAKILNFTLRETDLSEKELKDVSIFWADNKFLNIIIEDLERAANYGAKHLKIEYDIKIDSLKVSISGTPYSTQDKIIRTIDLSIIINNFTSEFQKHDAATEMLKYWEDYFSKQGFKMHRYCLYNSLTFELFTKRDLQNGK